MGSGSSSHSSEEPESETPRGSFSPVSFGDDAGSFDTEERSIMSPGDIVRVSRCDMGGDLEALHALGIDPTDQQQMKQVMGMAGQLHRGNPAVCSSCGGGSLTPEEIKKNEKRLGNIVQSVASGGKSVTIVMRCQNKSQAGDFSVWGESSASSQASKCVDQLTFKVARAADGGSIGDKDPLRFTLEKKGLDSLTILGDAPPMDTLKKALHQMSPEERVEAASKLISRYPCGTYTRQEFFSLFDSLLRKGYEITSPSDQEGSQ